MITLKKVSPEDFEEIQTEIENDLIAYYKSLLRDISDILDDPEKKSDQDIIDTIEAMM